MKPEIDYKTNRRCVDCMNATDYQTAVGNKFDCTIKCTKHRCRVYGLHGVCKDFKKDERRFV